jgi:predicted metal-binding membrane protein
MSWVYPGHTSLSLIFFHRKRKEKKRKRRKYGNGERFYQIFCCWNLLTFGRFWKPLINALCIILLALPKVVQVVRFFTFTFLGGRKKNFQRE